MYEIIYWLIYYQMGKNPVFSFGTYRLELHYLQRMTLYRKFNQSFLFILCFLQVATVKLFSLQTIYKLIVRLNKLLVVLEVTSCVVNSVLMM